MPACPNCGRPTLRTRDWACQWCGYPLLSRAYKKIDKTYKELQQERFPITTELPPEPEARPQPVSKPRPQPAPPPRPEAILTPPPRPAPKAPPPPKPEVKPQPEPAPALETPPQPERKSESVLITPPPAAASAPQLAPQPEPEPLTEPPPPPVALPDLDAITENSVLTVDELDALYKENRLAAHAKLTNKTVRINGFVEKVFIRDHIDVRYIVLTGARKKVVWPVRCTFSRESISQMSCLAAGQEVTLLGKYDSYGKNIIFKDCVLA